MITEPFEYHAPRTLEEALRLATQFGGDGKLLAGGQSLIPLMKLRLASPQHLIDLGRIPELAAIREVDGKISLGAMSTHFVLESSALLKAKCPLLPETAAEIGDVQIRNRGTLGGSLAHADPAGDWPAAILALEAELKAVGPKGERWIPARDFFVEMLTTALQADEILTEIRVPVLPPRSGEAYMKVHQPASGFAIVGVAVRLTLDDKGGCAKVGVGITGLAPKPFRASKVEALLKGKAMTSRRLAEAAAAAAEGVEAQGDLHASAEYRAHLARVYTRRALERALERAGK